jgi:cytochrome c peroxidase
MKARLVKLITIAALMGCALFAYLSSYDVSSASSNEISGAGFATVENLEASYAEWEAQYEKTGGDRNWALPMGWFKGLSTEHHNAGGIATLNLIDGLVSVEVKGLPKGDGWDVWLVDNGAGSVLPEAGENMLRIGSLQHDGKVAKLKADLGKNAFANFELDLIVVTKAGMTPIENRMLVGTTTLFNRLYRAKQRGNITQLSDHPKPEAESSKQGVFARLLEAVAPTAAAQIGPQQGVNNLITRGRTSFFNNTFNGNGRTCGTCHREDENLTINAEFISTLPQNDPLFVAETQPALARNFENPVLMRKFGLIMENVDGFDDLANKFVMRGVPHTLAMLPTTLRPRSDLVLSFGVDVTTVPPNERTGWSGDGAPGTGTLREFIIGAITQHYPRTLARAPASGGIAGDFRLPTIAELDELEAFQKSTGRRADLVLTGTGALRLKNESAARGQVIFNTVGNFPILGIVGSNAGAGKCFFCHNGGGSGDGVEVQFFGVPPTLTSNLNFNTGVENQPSRPQTLLSPAQLIPRDGGFGLTPNGDGRGGRGNGTFNVPVLIEAADTAPFFHDNSIATLEGAVEFYNSDSFNNSPAGGFVGNIKLEATEVEAVAAFLRVINALENIRSARDLAIRARNSTSQSIADELLKLSIAEIKDAIKVLNCANLHFNGQKELDDAVLALVVAIGIGDDFLRDVAITVGIPHLDAARAELRF